MPEEKKRKQRKRGNAEGSIYKMADGRWRGAITIGWKENAEGGKAAVRIVVTKPTRHEVAEEISKKLADRQKGIPIVSEKQTLAKFLENWLEQVVKPGVRPKTHRTYSDLCKLHITPALGNIPLGKLSPQQVREFLNAKLSDGLSARTVTHLLVTLRGALAVALKDGHIARNVAALVDPPRCQKAETAAFSPDEARAFLNAVRGQRYEAAFTAAVAVGLREGEVLGLRWSDVDLESGRLSVTGALQRVNKKLVRVEPKSKSSRRTIQLPAVCAAAFVKQQADQDAMRRWAGSRWNETGYVFTTRIGTPLDARDLLREYYRITRPKPKEEGTPAPNLGFPPIRFHDLRHSAATLLLAQGVSARYITELLGHRHVSFTMQTYAHVLPEVQKQVATKMDEILAPKPVATSVATKPTSSRPS